MERPHLCSYQSVHLVHSDFDVVVIILAGSMMPFTSYGISSESSTKWTTEMPRPVEEYEGYSKELPCFIFS